MSAKAKKPLKVVAVKAAPEEQVVRRDAIVVFSDSLRNSLRDLSVIEVAIRGLAEITQHSEVDADDHILPVSTMLWNIKDDIESALNAFDAATDEGGGAR